jgi:hypothetical protein
VQSFCLFRPKISAFWWILQLAHPKTQARKAQRMVIFAKKIASKYTAFTF